MTDKSRAVLVTFGRGGDQVFYPREYHGTYSSTSTGSGYGSPDKPHAAEGVPDGTPAINLLPAIETAAGIKMAISGPMVDVNLDPGAVSRLGKAQGIVADTLAADPGNSFGALVRLHNASTEHYGPLDQVAMDIYTALWQDAGAIVGTMQGGKFAAVC